MTKLSSFGLVIFTLAALYVLQHSTQIGRAHV